MGVPIVEDSGVVSGRSKDHCEKTDGGTDDPDDI